MLQELFISEVRVKMLSLFLIEADDDAGIHVREIARKVGAEINAVRRELDKLTRIKFLKREERGNRVYYTLRKDFLYYEELFDMFCKTSGICKTLIDNKNKLGHIKYMVISKAFLRGRKAGANDVDIIVVGNVNIDGLSFILKKEEIKRDSDINFTVFGVDEFDYRKQSKDTFIRNLLIEPFLMLIGDQVEFSK